MGFMPNVTNLHIQLEVKVIVPQVSSQCLPLTGWREALASPKYSIGIGSVSGEAIAGVTAFLHPRIPAFSPLPTQHHLPPQKCDGCLEGEVRDGKSILSSDSGSPHNSAVL